MGKMLVTTLFVYVCVCTGGINALSQQSTPSRVDNNRKAFLRQVPIAIGAVVQISTLDFVGVTSPIITSDMAGDGNTQFSKVAFAYERRDVGGDTPSADMEAMNRQAFETMNRLEKDGVKLETSEQQKASLTAALSDYYYQPSTTQKDRDKPKMKSRGSTEKAR